MEDNKDVQTTETVEKTTQKNYTVDDINNSFSAGVKKAYADLQKDEDYKKYLDWKKSNQNDSDKIKELETSNTNKDNRIKDLEAQLILNKSDVKPEFEKFVKNEVFSMINETTDFETALKNLKDTSPQYFGQTVVKKVQSSPVLAGGAKPQTTNDVMNSFIRGK